MSRRASRRLRLESLESRQLMAYDVDLIGGVLDIEGGSRDDVISIYYNLNTAQNKVRVEIRDWNTDELLLIEDRPLADVTKVEVHSFEGMDRITNLTSLPMKAFGGEGPDLLEGGSANDELNGEGGIDSLFGFGGNDLLRGGAGGDSYYLSEAGGADFIDDSSLTEVNALSLALLQHGVGFNLGSAVTQLLGPGMSVQLVSNTAISYLIGTDFDDILTGNSLDNGIHGRLGNDKIVGADGNDELSGDGGNDTLAGGAGDDRMFGGLNDDRYLFTTGSMGSDFIQDGPSASINAGNDTLDFGGFGRGVSINLNGSVAVQNSLLKLTLADGAFFENITGSPFDDTIIGNALANVISGRGGNDYIRAGAGNDTINGDAGADIVYAEEGNDKITSDAADVIYGGLGTDTFDGWSESPWLSIKNPRPTRYRDWGTR